MAVSGDEHNPTSGLDLETWRIREGLSYGALAGLLDKKQATEARRFALGERWPDPDVIDRIVAVTGGAVSVHALHRRRAAWLRKARNGRPKRVTVHTYGA